MDLDEIRVDVFRRTGINIEPGDPFYAALAMLNAVATRIEQNHAKTLSLIAQGLEAGVNEPRYSGQTVLDARLLKAIKEIDFAGRTASKLAREQAMHMLEGAIAKAVNNGWAASKSKGEKLFEDSAKQYQDALSIMISGVEARVSSVLKDYERQITKGATSGSSWKNAGVAMIGACSLTGVAVGVLTTFLTK
ncbi:hypothetical protein [Propionivibrio soli]|uniref:hypothetical protein n=1 Tax=Propionivibrio soli TaxID=2976531 RepID=UPI0021E9420C|nr:hypothetical protein [Propionivibrio soli]